MNESTVTQTFALALSDAAQAVARRLDLSLGAIRGISLAEYRILAALADKPEARASRVDLAQSVGLTPSGITRALRPMEKLGMVVTVKSKRDARLAIAGLTPAGRELLNDATGVVADTMASVVERASLDDSEINLAINLLARLSR